MEVGSYIRIVARYWWVVLVTMLVASGVAFGMDKVRHPQYSVQARVVAQPSTIISDTRTVVDLVGQLGAHQITGTLAQTFTSASVREAARQAAGLSPLGAEAYDLEANVLPDTTVIEVTASGPDPQVLTTYVNATIAATVSDSQAVFQVVDLVPLEQATVPTSPSSPVPSRDVPLGLGLGLGLGILLALALDYLVGSRGVPSEMRNMQSYLNQEVKG